MNEGEPLTHTYIYKWTDRLEFKTIHNENHDYHSVHAYGTAEVITREQEEEYLKGLKLLQTHNKRKPLILIGKNMADKLLILWVMTDYVTAKAKYPISGIKEVPIPANL